MASEVVIYLNRTNVIQVDLGMNITGQTITSQIRTQPDLDSDLIATFAVAVVDADEGELTLTLDNTVTDGITVKAGFMDLKRLVGGEPLAIFDRPLEVTFRGVVTQ